MNLKYSNIKKKEEYVLGIDLGTTNCCICIIKDNKPCVIPNPYTKKHTTPSIVTIFDKKINIGNYVNGYSFNEVKRLMGIDVNSDIINKEKLFCSYNIKINNSNIELSLNNSDVVFTPVEISAFLLTELKHYAELYTNETITKAVITVPAYFNELQRKATIDAAKIAKLDVLRIINEPTSAAIAYNNNNVIKNYKIIVVYDIGGGTTDVSLIESINGLMVIKGTNGNTHLGGLDFDKELVKYCFDYFKKNNSLDIKIEDINLKILDELKIKCEILKKELSIKNNSVLSIDNFYDNINLVIFFNQTTFNKIFDELIKLCLKPLDNLIKNAGINRNEVDEIILVGGMSKMPLIRNSIKNYFNKQPNISINPDEVVAIGAAIVGKQILNPSWSLVESESIIVVDTIPLSLGIDASGKMSHIIKRGMPIPITKKKIYKKSNINDMNIIIKIYEGERLISNENILLGEFMLEIINKNKDLNNENDEIEVSFSVNNNGIMDISAKSLLHGSINSVSLTKNILNNDEINNLINKSNQYIKSDIESLEIINLKNELELLCIKYNYKNIKIPETKKELQKLITDILVNCKKKNNKINNDYENNYVNNINLNKTIDYNKIENTNDNQLKNTYDNQKKNELIELIYTSLNFIKLTNKNNDKNIENYILSINNWLESNNINNLTISELKLKLDTIDLFCDSIIVNMK